MKVIKAQTAGFCFGVKRAVDQVYDLSAKEKALADRCLAEKKLAFTQEV